MFSHFRIVSGMAQNGNTLATQIMGQEIVKLLPEVYFATMPAGKLSKMRRQCSTMFPHIRIAFGTTQNGNTSATKIMGQEIVKLLPKVYFATMPAGKLSKMHRQSFRMFSHLRIASSTAQNGNTSAIKVMCQEIVKLLPEVYFATMLARNLSKMRQQSFRMFLHIWIASRMAQNGNTSATTIMGQEIVLEVFLTLAGILSSICRECFRMFSHTQIACSTAQNAEKSAQNPAKNSFQMLFNILICLKTSPEISNA